MANENGIARQMAAAPKGEAKNEKNAPKPTKLGGLLGQVYSGVTFENATGDKYDEKQGTGTNEKVIGTRQKVASFRLTLYGPSGEVSPASVVGSVNLLTYTDTSKGKSLKVSLPGASLMKATGTVETPGGRADADTLKNEIREHFMTWRKAEAERIAKGEAAAPSLAKRDAGTLTPEQLAALGL